MSDTNEPRKLGTTVTLAICSTIAFLAVLGAFVYLEANNKGTAGFMALLAFAAGTIPGIVNYRQNKEIKSETKEIKEQTNGPLSAKFEDLNSKLTQLSGKVNDVQRTQESYRSVMRQINPSEIPAQRQGSPNDHA